jgi:hypothetical protein
MASTKISSEHTASQIMSLLGKYGASHIMTTYNNNEIVGLSFMVKTGDRNIPFKLPIRWEPVLSAMKKDRHTPNHFCNEEQARRTAWRQILRWVEAQMTLIEIGMVDIREIFMPYILLDIEKSETYYERLMTTKFKLLE